MTNKENKSNVVKLISSRAKLLCLFFLFNSSYLYFVDIFPGMYIADMVRAFVKSSNEMIFCNRTVFNRHLKSQSKFMKNKSFVCMSYCCITERELKKIFEY